MRPAFIEHQTHYSLIRQASLIPPIVRDPEYMHIMPCCTLSQASKEACKTTCQGTSNLHDKPSRSCHSTSNGQVSINAFDCICLSFSLVLLHLSLCPFSCFLNWASSTIQQCFCIARFSLYAFWHIRRSLFAPTSSST